MDQKENKKAGADSRRGFIKKTAAATAAIAATRLFKTPVYGQTQAPSPGRVIGANDRIVVGHIGVGGQGMAHVRSIKENAADNNVVQGAVCDVSKYRQAEAKDYIEAENDEKKKGGATKDVKVVGGHRKMLENKDIDAVVIGTHDVWHAPCSIDAMEAGKHVYCEKPMTRYLDEAWKVHDTVKKTNKIFQVGSQICSDARWHEAAKWIRDGRIGPLVMGQDSYMRNNPLGEWNYPIQKWATADDIDWARWQGAAKKKVDFNDDYYFRWRKYYPYCAGLLGDLFPHRLHPFMLATGNPEFPTRVCSIGTKKILTDKKSDGASKTKYIRDVPENVGLLAEFPSGLTLLMISGTVNEQGLTSMMRGHKGTIYFGGDRIELKPEAKFADEVDPDIKQGLKPAGEKISEMERNWFSCIHTGQLPYANIDLAIRVQTVISLAEMAERLSVTCIYDEKTRKITSGPDGKELPKITYGWSDLS